MNDFLSRFGFKVFQKDFKWYVRGRELPFEFETDMVYFVAHPNNGSFVVGRFIEEKFKDGIKLLRNTVIYDESIKEQEVPALKKILKYILDNQSKF